MNPSASRRWGIVLCALVVLFAVIGPRLTIHQPGDQFPDFVYAPPMRPHIVDSTGAIRRPFVYALALENRLEHRFAADRRDPMPIRFFTGGALLSVDADRHAPWFPLGTDALGRDQLARLASGTRISLGVALTAAVGALLIGLLVGGIAGFAGGSVDDGLMRVADAIIALPAVYAVLALRASMPLVLTTAQVFWTMAGVLALVGWPVAARGIRAVIAAERTREYAEAARAIGATRTRLLLLHLLPATRGFVVVQATLLIPGFVLAEATLSYVGLGFGEPISSWGAMLRDAGRGSALLDAPWLLAPALAIVVATLSVNLLASASRTVPGPSKENPPLNI
jgi:peptide/nickel transport system permease protein